MSRTMTMVSIGTGEGGDAKVAASDAARTEVEHHPPFQDPHHPLPSTMNPHGPSAPTIGFVDDNGRPHRASIATDRASSTSISLDNASIQPTKSSGDSSIPPKVKAATHTPPPGLTVIPEILTVEEEEALIREVDARPWSGKGAGLNPELRRRTQQYGYIFSYRLRQVTEDLGELPEIFKPLLERVAHLFPSDEPPDSVIVNEYEVGQGIMPHVDSLKFGPVVISVSLLSPCALHVCRVRKKGEEAESADDHTLALHRRSAVVLSGESRYGYTHGISKDEIDWVDEERLVRSRRISLTIRRIQGYGWTVE
ncbi:hypothetical protein BJ684DRAFT_22115 [Piptocephalis cylindrospora]|uniref:Fe2OG dioxygenase domain-containing protein n=1 Tax=Piptocephalis cylindrospora TaxID=1907219 RepID=A0A4P9XY00_9FUNG|nr:hypothetical protein BJ684DRAFT_22115 [Piptocephalis cylindrospora]|eukprot:RKP11333.1 hypothetical protein BJ684DRAFT_22115 [Piptocephalis cylindrospora]